MRPRWLWKGLAARLALMTLASPAMAVPPDIGLFFQAGSRDEGESRNALAALARDWDNAYAGMILDMARLLKGPSRASGAGGTGAPSGDGLADEGAGAGARSRPSLDESAPGDRMIPGDPRRERLVKFLEKQTGQKFGQDLKAWRRWLWRQPYKPHPELLAFKAGLYSSLDPAMAAFFTPGAQPRIRLDEVDWGGVGVNGIPPLEHPRLVKAEDAAYLKGKNVVFGLVVNGEARAYPKRILAWHEMALDSVGGVELAVVYCTLCGTVIPYRAEVAGRTFRFGTSGLLYRSNKLMFDHETKSLWSAVEGRPVVGALAGSTLQLRALPVVTTTWEEWKARHPGTTVLSLETGFDRDYSEGAAYRGYFATDRLMFDIPAEDNRLKNKAEVLTLLLSPQGGDSAALKTLAISADFLMKNRLYQTAFAGRNLVVVTSRTGANRVYDAPAGLRFAKLRENDNVEDATGRAWEATEEALVPGDGSAPAPRLAARRAFWFGWHAQFPDTELIK